MEPSGRQQIDPWMTLDGRSKILRRARQQEAAKPREGMGSWEGEQQAQFAS